MFRQQVEGERKKQWETMKENLSACRGRCFVKLEKKAFCLAEYVRNYGHISEGETKSCSSNARMDYVERLWNTLRVYSKVRNIHICIHTFFIIYLLATFSFPAWIGDKRTDAVRQQISTREKHGNNPHDYFLSFATIIAVTATSKLGFSFLELPPRGWK